MKTKFIALAASSALVLPALAQTTFIGGATSNGDIEASASDATPFNGIAGAASTDFARSGTNSVKIDLTANNGWRFWKGITDPDATGIEFAVSADTEDLTASVWLLIPTATAFPALPNPTPILVLQLEASADDGATWANIPGSYKSRNLLTAARDTWIKVEVSGIDIPDGTTHIRTRPCTVKTYELVNGADADGGTDGTGPATPADWQTEGFDGFLYLDDFSLYTTATPPAGVIIQNAFGNGDFEFFELAPWNIEDGAGTIDTVEVHGGMQSLSIDLAVPTPSANKWRGMGLSATAPAVHGDVIGTSMWFYIPSTTTFGTTPIAFFNAELRSDRNTTGNGNLTGQLRQDLTALPTNQWVQVTKLTDVTDGDQTVTEMNLSGWNLETVNGADQASLGYGGLVYIDDVELINLGPAGAPGVLVDADKHNGDMEGAAWPAPWNNTDIDPWLVSGAGSASSAQNHTVGGSQSVEVDLTANNSNGKWKQLHPTFETIPTTANGYDRVDVSAWVYIPGATTFGAGGASLNLSIRNQLDGGGSANLPGAPSINLATAARDTWIEVSVTGFDMTGTDALAINNWNIATIETVNGKNGVTEATPADWTTEGYGGVIYIDDVYVKAYDSSTLVDPITINDTSWNAGTSEITIDYNTTFAGGVDVYYSSDLQNWTPDGSGPTGTGQTIVRTPGVSARYYILVESGAVFP